MMAIDADCLNNKYFILSFLNIYFNALEMSPTNNEATGFSLFFRYSQCCIENWACFLHNDVHEAYCNMSSM